MVNITEMKGDSYLPEGISREVALKIAGEMREILNRDLDEIDIALEVSLYDPLIDRAEMLAAWGYLTATERRGWKDFLDYDGFLHKERVKRAD